MTNLGVFSEFNKKTTTLPARSVQTVSKPVTTAQTPVKVQEVPEKTELTKKQKIVNGIKKAAPIVLPLAAIPVSVIVANKITTKNMTEKVLPKLKEELVQAISANGEAVKEEALNSIKEEAVKAAKEQVAQNSTPLWKTLASIAGVALAVDKITDDDKAKITSKAGERVATIETTASNAAYQNNTALLSKYTRDFNGITLMTNNGTFNAGLKDKAIENIKNSASKYLYNPPTTELIDNNATWSITSEFAPMKEGGLGAVPVDIQNNFAALGVNMPTFIPMYQEKGMSNFETKYVNVPTDPELAKKFNEQYELDIKLRGIINNKKTKTEDKEQAKSDLEKLNAERIDTSKCPTVKTPVYSYTYNGNRFRLNKVASFKLDTFQNGKTKVEDVEIFSTDLRSPKEIEDGVTPKPLMFIKNNNYFGGKIYQANTNTEEPEKFAFFSKAVYEFAKAKLDQKSVKGLEILDENAFNELKAPKSMILNDWQASSIAALARYKAPMENAYNQLSASAANALKDMRLITIGHNTVYQGSTQNDNNDNQRMQVTSNILNTLFDGYAHEIVTNAQSGASSTNKGDSGLKNLDNVLVFNKDNRSENHTNLLNMGVCLSDYVHPVSENYAKEIVEDNSLSSELQWALGQRAKSGSLVGVINGNDFNKLSIEAKKNDIWEKTCIAVSTYKKSDDIADIMNARKENKENYYKNYVLPLALTHKDETQARRKYGDTRVDFMKNIQNMEFVDPANNTNPPEDIDLENTPIFASVGRLVSQKGVDKLAKSINMVYDTWAKKFPGKNKPIFYIGGADGEGGQQRKYLDELKSKLKPEDSSRVIFTHGFSPMPAVTSAADFFLLPSNFEPCGLTQGEAMALATPVIASKVGGIVDTVNRNGKTNGIFTKDIEGEAKGLTSKKLYNAIIEGADVFFNHKEQYEKMVRDAIDEDFSWIQKDKKGPSFDYLKTLGYNIDTLPDIK